MDTATFLATLAEARAAWEELLAQVDEARMEEAGAAGKWSVKDIVAHVMWCEREMVSVMREHALIGSDLWKLSNDESNEIVYQQNRTRHWRDIMREERQVYAELLEESKKLNDEDLNDAHAYKDMPLEWIPWQLYAGNSFEHYKDHMPSIREWLGQG